MRVVKLPDDPRLSAKATRRRQSKQRGTPPRGRFAPRSVTKQHQHHLLTVVSNLELEPDADVEAVRNAAGRLEMFLNSPEQGYVGVEILDEILKERGFDAEHDDVTEEDLLEFLVRARIYMLDRGYSLETVAMFDRQIVGPIDAALRPKLDPTSDEEFERGLRDRVPPHIRTSPWYDEEEARKGRDVAQSTLAQWLRFWQREARKHERARRNRETPEAANEHAEALGHLYGILAIMYAKGYNVSYEQDPDNLALAPLDVLQERAKRNRNTSEYGRYLEELDRRAVNDVVILNVAQASLEAIREPSWREWAAKITWSYPDDPEHNGNATPSLMRIGLKPNPSAHATAMHELGHLLDYQLHELFTGSRLTALSERSREELEAVPTLGVGDTEEGRFLQGVAAAMVSWKDRAFFKRLEIATAIKNSGGTEHELDYFTRWREIWARAFELYAAETLGGEFKKSIERRKERWGVAFSIIWWDTSSPEWALMREEVGAVLDAAEFELDWERVGELSIPVIRIKRRGA